MPTPKRKTSKSRRDKRSAGKHIRFVAVTKCQNCSAALRPHQACADCGFYKGVKVLTTKADRAVKRGQVKAKSKEAQDLQMPSGSQEPGSSEQTR